ncbi:hypothetical protein [Chlorobaculum sp. 24CR]|uniref:hypothetical protein n=1 Tax=Chlorobaculum sp. 24CR TaxID=2508878 RepID=UPI00143226BC|nr:hypothetical protein [Chlorobaculum sp. 24CR]
MIDAIAKAGNCPVFRVSGGGEKWKSCGKFPPIVCYAVQVIYIHINVLAEVQGRFTFSPQQMPHASTYIQNAPLEFAGEKPLVSGVRRRCGWWVVSDLDGGFGANQVWRKLKATLMMNKRDFVALICSLREVKSGRVPWINKLCLMLREPFTGQKMTNI